MIDMTYGELDEIFEKAGKCELEGRYTEALDILKDVAEKNYTYGLFETLPTSDKL